MKKNLDIYVEFCKIAIMMFFELKIITYFYKEAKKNLDEFNKINNHKSNKIDIFTDHNFRTIYGQIKLVFEKRNKSICLLAIEPEEIFLTGHMKNLEIYRGVPILNERDRFKVETLKRLEALNDN